MVSNHNMYSIHVILWGSYNSLFFFVCFSIFKVLFKLWKENTCSNLLLCCRWNWILIMQIVLVDFVETSMVFLSKTSSFIMVYMVIHSMYECISTIIHCIFDIWQYNYNQMQVAKSVPLSLATNRKSIVQMMIVRTRTKRKMSHRRLCWIHARSLWVYYHLVFAIVIFGNIHR